MLSFYNLPDSACRPDLLLIGIFLTKDYINLSLLNYTTYKYRSLLFFVFFQVILAAFSRILSAKCRIVLSNAHFF